MTTPTIALDKNHHKDCQTDSGDKNKVSTLYVPPAPRKHHKRKDDN